jgi:hypothetical protein
LLTEYEKKVSTNPSFASSIITTLLRNSDIVATMKRFQTFQSTNGAAAVTAPATLSSSSASSTKQSSIIDNNNTDSRAQLEQSSSASSNSNEGGSGNENSNNSKWGLRSVMDRAGVALRDTSGAVRDRIRKSF